MESEQTNSNSQTSPAKTVKKSHLIVVIGIIVIIIGALLWLYALAGDNTQRAFFSKIPLPIAFVKTTPVFGSDFYERVDLAKKVASNNSLPLNNINEVVMQQLIDNKRIDFITKEKGIAVSDEELNASFDKILASNGPGNESQIEEELKNVYGMTIDQFKNRILKQTILQENLTLWYTKQEQLNPTAYQKARELVSKLDAGTSFEDVAKQYTEDEASQQFAGDSGFIKYSAMLPEFQSVVKDIELNQPKIVASRAGLHIIIVTAAQDGENSSALEDKSFEVKQIYIQPDNFQEWINGELDKISSLILI